LQNCKNNDICTGISGHLDARYARTSQVSQPSRNRECSPCIKGAAWQDFLQNTLSKAFKALIS